MWGSNKKKNGADCADINKSWNEEGVQNCEKFPILNFTFNKCK